MDETTPSPFAPPTGPPAGSSAAASPTPFEMSGPEPQPPSKRRWWLPVAVLAIVVIGVVGIVLAVRGGDADVTAPDADDPGAFSFSQAVERASEGEASRAARFVMSMELGLVGEMEMAGALDDDGRMSMEMDLFDGEGSFEMVMDVPDATAYFRGDMIPGGGDGWIGMELDEFAATQGLDADTLREQLGAPADMAQALVDLDATEVGPTEIDGEPVMQYRVELDGDDLAGALESNPLLGDAPGLLPDEVGYEVYVTADNRLRRMVMEFDMLGETVAMQIDQFPVEDGFEVELPDRAEVEFLDADELLDAQGLFG